MTNNTISTAQSFISQASVYRLYFTTQDDGRAIEGSNREHVRQPDEALAEDQFTIDVRVTSLQPADRLGDVTAACRRVG